MYVVSQVTFIKMKAFVFGLACFLGLMHSAWSSCPSSLDWNYEGNYYWPEQCNNCAGDRQSPINIDISEVLHEDIVGPLKYHGIWDSATFFYTEFTGELINNGHVLQFDLDPAEIGNFRISHAQLPNDYIFAQFHFHWGSTNDQGSEHTINGVAFPMEMHMVHYNSKYDSLDDALDSEDDDALAVIALMFQAEETRNYFTYLDPIFAAIVGEDEGSGDYNLDAYEDTEPVEDIYLGGFLDEVGFGHYYYRGSLTTPTCNQQVFWIVMERTIAITEEELNIFREFINFKSGAPMVDNYRPPQPLNNRIVRRVEEKCRCEHPDGVCARDGTCYVFFDFASGLERESLPDVESMLSICSQLGMILPEPRSWDQHQALADLLYKRGDALAFLNIKEETALSTSESEGRSSKNKEQELARDAAPAADPTYFYLSDGAEIDFSKWLDGVSPDLFSGYCVATGTAITPTPPFDSAWISLPCLDAYATNQAFVCQELRQD